MATNIHYGAPLYIFQHAEKLRKSMTEAEKIIWARVCKNQLGVKIRRQHPLWKFVADFYCHAVKLVIEVDGGIHLRLENKEYDISRGITLEDFGIEIIRFTNDQVLKETESVMAEIRKAIETIKHNQHQSSHKISVSH